MYMTLMGFEFSDVKRQLETSEAYFLDENVEKHSFLISTVIFLTYFTFS